MNKDWTLAFSTNQEYIAELAKRMFGDNGIESVIINKKDMAYQNFGDVELYVHHSNIIRAKKLIEDFEKTK